MNSSQLQDQADPLPRAQSSAQLLPNAPLANRASSLSSPPLPVANPVAHGNSKEGTFKKPEFKPRDKGKKFKKKEEGDGGAYRNRAEERRLGKDSDFAGVEKLLEVSRRRREVRDWR